MPEQLDKMISGCQQEFLMANATVGNATYWEVLFRMHTLMQQVLQGVTVDENDRVVVSQQIPQQTVNDIAIVLNDSVRAGAAEDFQHSFENPPA